MKVAILPHRGLMWRLRFGMDRLNRMELVENRIRVVLGLNVPDQLETVGVNLFERACLNDS